MSPGYWQRLAGFADIIYEPKQHILFACLWFLSIQGLFVLLSPEQQWHWGLHSIISAATFFGVLFVLRAIDEVKDLEYDRQYNPDRPLVSGVVGMADIRSYVVFGTLIIAASNSLIAWQLSLFVILNIGYGLLLMWLEKVIPLMDRSLFFNLLITYPVSIALSFYTLTQSHFTQHTDISANLLPVIGCYILAFLHFEIVRKSMWEQLSDPGEKLYSSEIGCKAALLLATLIGTGAIGGIVCLIQPWKLTGILSITGWLPLVNLVFIALSLKLFFSNRQQRFNARKFSVPFIVGFYLFNLIHGLTWNQHQFGLF